MPITLTEPETRPPSTTARIVEFSLCAPNRSARILYRVGYMEDGEFRHTREVEVVVNDYDPEADFTFTQLLAAVPEVRTLADALEAVAISVGIFDGTTV